MKLTSRQAKLINEMIWDDAQRALRGRELRGAHPINGLRMTVRAFRRLVNEAAYDINIDQVHDNWSTQLDDAIEFIMCHMNVDAHTARGHVTNNWVFDTLDHDGETVLLARDEATNDALAYTDKMGGWYYRLTDNNPKCRQQGSQRGTATGTSSDDRPPRDPVSGTKVSGQKSDRMKNLEAQMYRGHDI